MELLELRYFVMVADAGSFSRAAVKLGMTQPALSRQVQKLEQELRTSLFYRHGRGVTLTEAGRTLADAVRPLLQRLVDVKEALLAQGDRPTGVVTFGVPPSIGNTLAAPLAQRFREACPEATLRVHEAFSSTLLEWIESGRLDLAVLYDARRDRNLVVSPLLLEDFFLIQPAGGSGDPTALDMADIAALPLVLPGPENGFRRVIDAAARRAKIDLTIAMELDSIAALKQLVEAGAGSTILPFGAVHQEVLAGRLRARPIASAQMRAMLVTATPSHRPISRATHVLLRLVQAEVERCIETGVLKGRIHGLTRHPDGAGKDGGL
ncbi:MAG TPA: LysR substrate-binding domain-containing protein [Aliidongia sp.]|uniref:LysR family transcriptional regulator n=1 Tax=Aliidongia sp. TaxID=1914230 RepID=UPI002DDC93DF|nr:LysR substrate-binding domain-containing protein [Aliidongia sp.]HEV2678414.1 LysR substrate-binding domain-containing protein [Aliidongia sp.]